MFSCEKSANLWLTQLNLTFSSRFPFVVVVKKLLPCSCPPRSLLHSPEHPFELKRISLLNSCGMALYSFNLGVIFVSVQRDVLNNATEIEDQNSRRLFTTKTNVIRDEKVKFVRAIDLQNLNRKH